MASAILNALGVTFLWVGVLTLSIQCIGVGGVFLYLARSEGRYHSFRLGRSFSQDQSGHVPQPSLLRLWGVRLILISAMIQVAGFLAGCALTMSSMQETWLQMSGGVRVSQAAVNEAVEASLQVSLWIVTLATPPAIAGVILLVISCALPNRYSFQLHG